MVKYLFLFLLSCSIVFAQSAPDVVVNAESPQGGTVENQNFANLYQAQSQTASTVSAINGYYANGVLSVNNGGTGQNASTWTSGDYVYMASTGVFGHQPLPPQPHGIAFFTTTGTTAWVAPAGVTAVWVTLQGGGSSGNSDTATPCDGGGAGAFLTDAFYPVNPLQSYNVVVGAGGAGVSGAHGGCGGANGGGNSSFNSNLIANGSAGTSGGAVQSSSNMNASTVTGGSQGLSFGTQIAGGNGALHPDGNNAGAGGGSVFGSGANGGGSANNAVNYGTGGSGAFTNGTSGSGFQGIAWIQY